HELAGQFGVLAVEAEDDDALNTGTGQCFPTAEGLEDPADRPGHQRQNGQSKRDEENKERRDEGKTGAGPHIGVSGGSRSSPEGKRGEGDGKTMTASPERDHEWKRADLFRIQALN